MAERYESEEQEAELRGKLVKRLAIAGVMVALLLGALAFFDHLSRREEPEPKVYTKPVPVPPKKEVTQPVTPDANQAEAPKPDAAPAPAQPAAPAEPPPRPEVAAQPSPDPGGDRSGIRIVPPRPETPPAKAEAVRPVPETTSAPTTKTAEPPPPVRTAPTGPAPAAPAAAAPPAQPATQPPVAQPQPVITAPPPLPRLLAGYVVQAGVFSNARAAEELHAKLALNGIPSSLEARVQVGPFKSRAEADAARQKMKALGIEAIVINPSGRAK